MTSLHALPTLGSLRIAPRRSSRTSNGSDRSSMWKPTSSRFGRRRALLPAPRHCCWFCSGTNWRSYSRGAEEETGADDLTRVTAAVLAGRLRGLARESTSLRTIALDDLTAAWAVRLAGGGRVSLGKVQYAANRRGTSLKLDGVEFAAFVHRYSLTWSQSTESSPKPRRKGRGSRSPVRWAGRSPIVSKSRRVRP